MPRGSLSLFWVPICLWTILELANFSPLAAQGISLPPLLPAVEGTSAATNSPQPEPTSRPHTLSESSAPLGLEPLTPDKAGGPSAPSVPSVRVDDALPLSSSSAPKSSSSASKASTPPATSTATGSECPPDSDSKKTGDAKQGSSGDRFANVPAYAIFPRPGYFPIFPTGPGYYSLMDVLQDNYRENAPRYPYPRFAIKQNSFFDIDWRYLDDPNNTETDYFDFLKRRRFGPEDMFLWTGGGELRGRYNYEVNARLLNAPPENPFRGRDNTFDLYRLRLYSDLMITERLRWYVEGIFAYSPDFLFPPLIVDRNDADFLNLFLDAQVCTLHEQPLWFRVGRQELLYGSQRLVSPLDWVNTRRTFQGGKLFWHTPKRSVDLFLVQPVIPNVGKLDSVDNNILFGGLWYQHRPRAGEFLDAYYLMLDDTNPVFEGRDKVLGGKTVHTFGARWCGDRDNWVWDVEAMLQCGEYVNQGLLAKAFTVAGGYHFKDWWSKPIFWLSYDYASGTPNPGEGTLNQTFSQLYPFGHYYLGFIDIVGRRNIIDVSAYWTMWPTNWITLQAQCHNFWLDSAKDALYNAGGIPIRRDPTGQAGNYVGTELDFLVNFHLSNHTDLLLSYSYMFAGPFIIETATTPGGKQNPQALYVQYNYRF